MNKTVYVIQWKSHNGWQDVIFNHGEEFAHLDDAKKKLADIRKGTDYRLVQRTTIDTVIL